MTARNNIILKHNQIVQLADIPEEKKIKLKLTSLATFEQSIPSHYLYPVPVETARSAEPKREIKL